MTLVEKILLESKTDSLAYKIVKQFFPAFKSKYESQKWEIKDYEFEGISTYKINDVTFFLNLSISDEIWSIVDKAFSVNGTTTPEKEIIVTVNATQKCNKSDYDLIYNDMINTIRHELEHIAQINKLPNRENTEDLQGKSRYLDYPNFNYEYEAFIKGAYAAAKKSRRPFWDVMIDNIERVGVDTDREAFINKLKDYIKKRKDWNLRLK